MDPQVNFDPPAAPEDARNATDEQRTIQKELQRRGEDPDAPALHQSHHQIADESRR